MELPGISIAIPLLVSSAALATEPAVLTFCERLAPQLGMRPDMVVPPGEGALP